MQVKATARGIIAQFDTVLTGRGRGVHTAAHNFGNRQLWVVYYEYIT